MRHTFVFLKSAAVAAALMTIITAPTHAQTAATRAKAKADSVRADSIRADSVKKANAKKAAAAPTSKPATANTKAAATTAAPASTKASSSTSKPAASSTKTAATTSKPATTTSKPASTSSSAKPATSDSKATTSTAKPAASGSSGSSTAAPAKSAGSGSSSGSAGSSTSTRGSGSTTPSTRTAAPVAKKADTGRPRSQDPVAFTSVALYAGMAQGSLGFGAGPSGGLSLRVKKASLPIVFRFDAQGSRFSQTPTAFGSTVPLTSKATLTHVGATAGVEVPLIKQGPVRPYLLAGGGVFRFQGSGPAGSNSKDLNDGVFTSTTDGALTIGGGVRLGSKLFLEARYITVSDFNSIPVVLGFSFK